MQVEVEMTSGLYIAYKLGYTCATMVITMRCNDVSYGKSLKIT